MAQGVEATRAQQLENWNNQQEVLNKRRQQKYMTEEFDKVSSDENWRSLSSFSVERNQVRFRAFVELLAPRLICCQRVGRACTARTLSGSTLIVLPVFRTLT
jgi:hypothetical protein